MINKNFDSHIIAAPTGDTISLHVSEGSIPLGRYFVIDGLHNAYPMDYSNAILSYGEADFYENHLAYDALVEKHKITHVVVWDFDGPVTLTVDQWRREGFWLQAVDRI